MASLQFNARLRRSPWTRWIVSLKQFADHAKTKGLVPSEVTKRRLLLSALRHYRLDTLVETGTFLGDTAHYIGSRGYRVKTIEVEPTLAALARERFKNFRNIEVLQGDSGDMLGSVIAQLDGTPALFYLDGHYSGGFTGMGESETPILKEIDVILSQAAHRSMIMVDDARCFGTSPGYPDLQDFLDTAKGRGCRIISVNDDRILFSISPDEPGTKSIR